MSDKNYMCVRTVECDFRGWFGVGRSMRDGSKGAILHPIRDSDAINDPAMEKVDVANGSNLLIRRPLTDRS
jgi:hypothetical protein